MCAYLTRCKRRDYIRAASFLALAGVLASSLGIVFVPATRQDSSQAFPCQGGSCGCSTAAQCWQSCCCTTVAERLAWAKTHGVKPPAFLNELLANAKVARPKAEQKLCCSNELPQNGHAESCAVEPDGEPLARLVLMSELSRCRGLSKYIAIFGSAICEPLPDTVAIDFAPTLWLRPHDECFESPLASPPIPPPRIVG